MCKVILGTVCIILLQASDTTNGLHLSILNYLQVSNHLCKLLKVLRMCYLYAVPNADWMFFPIIICILFLCMLHYWINMLQLIELSCPPHSTKLLKFEIPSTQLSTLFTHSHSRRVKILASILFLFVCVRFLKSTLYNSTQMT
jgi:hypothetical protein